MFRPITKWNTSVANPGVIPEVVRKAFKIAEMEKPGATHIEISEDIASLPASVDSEVISPEKVRRPRPDHKAINASAEIIKKAKRPIILAGNGAIRKLASKQLLRLVERHNIPVVSTFMGKGAIPDNNIHSLLTIGLGFSDYIMEAMQKTDLVIAVGYDIAEYSPQNWNSDRNKKIVHIDFVPAETYTSYPPLIEVVADISATLWELNERLMNESLGFDEEWYTHIRKRVLKDIASYDLTEGATFTIPGVLNIVRSLLDEDGLMLSDVGSHKMWIARNFPTYCPNGCIISNGLASMGISLPGAIAASLIDPTRQVIAAMGDGGFLMNSQELETAKRLGVAFTTLVFNDNDYGLISWKQQMSRGKSTGTTIENPDIKAYAESFGIKGYSPKTLDELRSQLELTISNKELAVMEIKVDSSVNSELLEKLNSYWKDQYHDAGH
jgi:acetolactate synthase-1/2/3 large subunit